MDFRILNNLCASSEPTFAIGKNTGSLYALIRGKWTCIVPKKGVHFGDSQVYTQYDLDILPVGTKIEITV